jgi:hydrogenase expression/formation protein HypC
MCLAIPGKIVHIDAQLPDLAVADVSGVQRKINIGILADENIQPGDWVLIHVGFAMSKMDEEQAREALDFLQQLGDAYAEELEALQQAEGADE